MTKTWKNYPTLLETMVLGTSNMLHSGTVTLIP